MMDGLIPTHHEPAVGQVRSFIGKPQAPSYGQTSVSAHRSTTVLGNDTHASHTTQRKDARVRLSSNLFPSDSELANVGSLPLGAVIGTGAFFQESNDVETKSTRVNHAPSRCVQCFAFVSGFCIVDASTGHWQCCFCGTGNVDHTALRNNECDASALLELCSPNVEFEWVTGDEHETHKSAGANFTRTSKNSNQTKSPIVFVLDETLDDDELQLMCGSILQSIDNLSKETPVGIVTFGAAVSAYDQDAMNKQSIDNGNTAHKRLLAVAHVVPGHKSPDSGDLRSVMLGYESHGASNRFIQKLGSCRDAIKVVLNSLKCGSNKSPAKRDRPRSVGAAIETAATVVCQYLGKGDDDTSDNNLNAPSRSPRNDGGRVCVCLGGPPTRGPGSANANVNSEFFVAETNAAAAYVNELAETLASLSVSVDVFSCGRESAHANRLAPLASKTGGCMVVEDDFGDAFAKNLESAAARQSIGRNSTTLSIQTSPGVRCTQLIGPAGSMSAEETQKATERDVSNVADAFALKSVDASQSVSVFFEYDSDTLFDENKFMFLQCIVWVDTESTRVAKCATVRVPITASRVAYARAIDVPVASLLAAKKTVLDVQKTKSAKSAEIVSKWIEHRVRDVARCISGDAGSKNTPFPEDLARFALSMYHLRRGPMLGHGFGHEDEKSAARLRFLGSGLEVGCLSLVPKVYVLNREELGGGVIDSIASIREKFSIVPAVDLALASRNALLVDHGDHGLFGWIGRDVSVDEREFVSSALAALAHRLVSSPVKRFPIPKTKIVFEGSSAARFVVVRLAPGHRDAPHQQDVFFPRVVGTSGEQRRAFAALAPYTEEVTFFQWMRGMGVDAPLAGWR